MKALGKSFLLFVFLLFCLTESMYGQFTFGTTGLLHLPTADMQQDKTVMAGGGYLDRYATPDRWDYDTWNYYLNVTIFPWFEVAYTMTLFTGKDMSGDRPDIRDRFNKWANQDRNFSFRLRAWKEGWWKPWTPQVVIGANDLLHTFSSQNGGNVSLSTSGGNGFWARSYVAVTKHFDVKRMGTLGIHAAYMHNNRDDFHYEGVGIGANLLFDQFSCKYLRGMNLMAEYDTRTLNVGLGYSLWKDRINWVCELNRLKYLSTGICLKIRLK